MTKPPKRRRTKQKTADLSHSQVHEIQGAVVTQHLEERCSEAVTHTTTNGTTALFFYIPPPHFITLAQLEAIEEHCHNAVPEQRVTSDVRWCRSRQMLCLCVSIEDGRKKQNRRQIPYWQTVPTPILCVEPTTFDGERLPIPAVLQEVERCMLTTLFQEGQTALADYRTAEVVQHVDLHTQAHFVTNVACKGLVPVTQHALDGIRQHASVDRVWVAWDAVDQSLSVSARVTASTNTEE